MAGWQARQPPTLGVPAALLLARLRRPALRRQLGLLLRQRRQLLGKPARARLQLQACALRLGLDAGRLLRAAAAGGWCRQLQPFAWRAAAGSQQRASPRQQDRRISSPPHGPPLCRPLPPPPKPARPGPARTSMALRESPCSCCSAWAWDARRAACSCSCTDQPCSADSRWTSSARLASSAPATSSAARPGSSVGSEERPPLLGPSSGCRPRASSSAACWRRWGAGCGGCALLRGVAVCTHGGKQVQAAAAAGAQAGPPAACPISPSELRGIGVRSCP
jgi:hypothetical protein